MPAADQVTPAREPVFVRFAHPEHRRQQYPFALLTEAHLSLLDYENTTLGQRRAGLAASRLAHSPIMIKEKAA